jgi:hypothetical protein
MSYPVSRHEQEISVPANSRYTLPLGNADYIRFHTVPSGVMVKINGGSSGAFIQGETHQAEPGSGELREVSFENTTAGALAVRVIFGLGKIDVSGVATISGVLPLPTGAATEAKQDTQTTRLNLLATENTLAALLAAAATAAKQDTQITRLNLLSTEAKQDSIIGVLTSLIAIASTADLQAAGNASVASLAANTVETPDLESLGASADRTFTGCKRITVLNTDTGSEAVTLNFAGGTSRTLAAGRSATFVVTKPLATLASVRVRTTGSGSALVNTMT